MKADLKILKHLLKIRESLVRDIEQIDLAIAEIEPNQFIELDKLANEETLGIHEFKNCKNMYDKIQFALSRMGRANISDMVKFLKIVGETMDEEKLKYVLFQELKVAKSERKINKMLTGNKAIYSLYSKLK